MAHGSSSSIRRLGAWVHRHATWVLVFWLLVAGALNVAIPQLERTVSTRSADFLPADLPANIALEEMSEDFEVPASNAVSSVVLVNENGIGPDDEAYYRELVTRLVADHVNIAYLLDTYGNPVTRSIALSPDGKAINLMLASEGTAGSTRAHHATLAIRDHIAAIPHDGDLRVYYSGPTATLSDLFSAIDVSLLIITGVSVLLIAVLLFAAYRDLITALIPLVTIGITLAVVRPIVSAIGAHGLLPISNFTIAIMTALVLGAGTDYAIFTVANYHEARRGGLPIGPAVADATGRTGPILIASALTIAAACGSMAFAKIGMFTTAGPPTAVAVLIALAVALTLPSALLSLAGRRGWAEPRRLDNRRWQRRGAAIVRRAGAYTAATLAFLIGMSLITVTFEMNWDEAAMPIYGTESTRGYDAVREHYGVNEIAPEYLTIRSDHDLRNTTDLAAMELAAMAVAKLPQVAKVRSITRPDGEPLPEAAIGHQTGVVGGQLHDAHRQMVDAAPQLRRLAAGVDQLGMGAASAVERMPELVDGTRQVVDMADSVLDGLDSVDRIAATLTGDDARSLAASLPALRAAVASTESVVTALAGQDRSANATVRQLDSVFGPLASPSPPPSCVIDPSCLAARASFAQLDRLLAGRASAAVHEASAFTGVAPELVDRLTTALPQIRSALDTLDRLLGRMGDRSPEAIRADLRRLTSGVGELSTGMGQLADGLRQVKEGTDTTVAMTGQLQDGLRRASEYLNTMSASTSSGPGAGFYLPRDALGDERFVEGSKLLISPDGRTARMLVTWGINPYSNEALDTTHQLPGVVERTLRGTTLGGSEVTTTGLASLSADAEDQVKRDFLLFATVAALAVLMILMVLLRSVLAPAILLATVLLSFAATVGISVLVWQHIIGFPLDWSVVPVSFMALIAVGADYSMLFASRIREESADDGMVRGIIRGFGSTGGVITTAGIVFALTMFALMSGTVLNLVQIGFTIGVGLLIDIALVRTVLVPAAMTVIGERIWWPAKPARSTATSATPDPAR